MPGILSTLGGAGSASSSSGSGMNNLVSSMQKCVMCLLVAGVDTDPPSREPLPEVVSESCL